MTVRQLIPEGLAEMTPGPELSVLLAEIDIHALAGADAVEVLRARARQLSHDQARLLAVMVEVGLCDPDAGAGEVARLAQAPSYAADEIRAALAWTRHAADREFGFAETLVVRMHPVFTALEAGRICRSKAWVFADLCADLTAEQAEVVFARLLPLAGGLTTGEPTARIKKLAIALDPGWAERRYVTAVRERTEVGYLNPEGTATVTGSALPVDQAALACAHVEELARAAKRAGHPGRIGPLRADIYLGLLDGRWQYHTRDQIIAELITLATGDPDDGAGPDDPTYPDSPTEPSGGDGVPADAAPMDSTGTRGDEVSAAAGSGPVAEGRAQSVRRVGVEVLVGLSTLLGWDRHPAEVAGWGTVTAEVARALVTIQHGAEWRYALTDSTGQLLLAWITRRRPQRGAPGSAVSPGRGGIVELQLPATVLTERAADLDAWGEWAAVVADLAAQYARFAGAGLRRHVQVRDRACVYPGCRCSARSADLDHTVDHTYGGVTTEGNTGLSAAVNGSNPGKGLSPSRHAPPPSSSSRTAWSTRSRRKISNRLRAMSTSKPGVSSSPLYLGEGCRQPPAAATVGVHRLVHVGRRQDPTPRQGPRTRAHCGGCLPPTRANFTSAVADSDIAVRLRDPDAYRVDHGHGRSVRTAFRRPSRPAGARAG